MSGSLDQKEVDRFDIIAEEWWDRDGKFKPLHKLNPARILYIHEQLITHFARNARTPGPLNGLTIADIGCGGGLIAEPLARLGGTVTGIDPSPESIAAAKQHAASAGLEIEYINASAEDIAGLGRTFDAVLALEVIEHTRDPEAFVATCKNLVRPGGMIVLSTLNRTAKSYALGIVAAEYLLRWLPRGTHDWSRFLTPDELEEMLAGCGLTPIDRRGVSYNPLADEWRLSSDCGVNYFITATRPADA
jgi:2-polyprenyl-6-hydroxyphenyl methylase/3-demethylubiquinone-9 3-methyltransferase